MMDNKISQAAFARLQGWDKSHVTRLKQMDRLVMEDGKVVVDASIARIKATEDPNRDDVRQRHAAERQAADGDPVAEARCSGYQEARARKEEALADMAEMDRDQQSGKLMLADEVRLCALEAGATLRTMLEAIPDQLAPQLTTITDCEGVHSLLAKHIEHALTEVSNKMAEMAKETA